MCRLSDQTDRAYADVAQPQDPAVDLVSSHCLGWLMTLTPTVSRGLLF